MAEPVAFPMGLNHRVAGVERRPLLALVVQEPTVADLDAAEALGPKICAAILAEYLLLQDVAHGDRGALVRVAMPRSGKAVVGRRWGSVDA